MTETLEELIALRDEWKRKIDDMVELKSSQYKELTDSVDEVKKQTEEILKILSDAGITPATTSSSSMHRLLQRSGTSMIPQRT